MRTMLIKDLGIIVTGNTPSKSEPEFYNSNDIHFIKPDLIGNTGITQINHSKEYISEKARKKARVVRKNTVLVTCIGNIGKVGFVEVDEVAFNQQINAIIPNKNVLPRYLAYALLANQQRLESIANAPVVPIINKTQFENFYLSIHDDLTEQDKITRILDNISKELMFRQKQINEYDQLIKSRFVEMFGDIRSNSRGLKSKLGKELFKFSSGKFLSEDKRFDFGVPVYGGNGVAWYTSDPLIDFPTIVIGRVGAYCGNIKIVKEPIWITDNAIYIKEFYDDSFNLDFLFDMMRIMDFSRFADYSGQPKITQKPLENSLFLIPNRQEQEEFSKFVNHIDKLKFEDDF